MEQNKNRNLNQQNRNQQERSQLDRIQQEKNRNQQKTNDLFQFEMGNELGAEIENEKRQFKNEYNKNQINSRDSRIVERQNRK